MKKLSAIYFALSIVAVILTSESEAHVVLVTGGNLILSYILARKYNPQIFYK